MSSGPIGYSDWQQLVSWDAGSLAWTFSGPQSGVQTSPVIDCHAFGYTYIHMNQQVASALCTQRWYADQAATHILGTRQWVFDSSNTGQCQLEFPNLGPYTVVTIDPGSSGPAFTANVDVLLTNRIHSAIVSPASFTFGQFAPTLAAGASVTDTFNAYWAGPYAVHCFGGSQGVTIQPQYMTAGLVWANIHNYAVAANADDYRVLIHPLSVARVVITNASATIANNTATIQFHYPATGSS